MLCPPGSSFGDLDQLVSVIKAVRAADPARAHEVALHEVASREEDFSDYLRGRFRSDAGVPRTVRSGRPTCPPSRRASAT